MYSYFSRDISWLGFNGRVLEEAAKDAVPLFERIKFLSIYSSNLDEFYRVRIPTLMAISQVKNAAPEIQHHGEELAGANQMIAAQLNRFGTLLREELLPQLLQHKIHLLYKEPVPQELQAAITAYFYSQVLCFIQPLWLEDYQQKFFPENNKLYLLVILKDSEGKEHLVIVNIPSDAVSRFFSLQQGEIRYIIFLDDVLKANLDKVFKGFEIAGSFSFKITRDAELELQDEYSGDLADKIEKQLEKRDAGFATRFLYEPDAPLRIVHTLIETLGINSANIVEGGSYHNLKDLVSLPLNDYKLLSYQGWPAVAHKDISNEKSLLDTILEKDIALHVPYHAYHPVIRFFSEAATDAATEEIYVTLYRVASDSRIVNALISAAKNGKKVTVFVELKARFDEANNLKWSKKMKAAGVKIINSIPGLKVHAKTGLVKRKRSNGRLDYIAILATGNFNESTARFYTDHILFTADKAMVTELEMLFMFLAYREHADQFPGLQFRHLLVAQFNLQQQFIALIDREIAFAKEGKPAHIIIKLNNLEEKSLIAKLYDASEAGVKIQLIVRSICCLIPGIAGMSENINITRIVDRYLEHGRIFIFHNNGDKEVYMGSADWMNRNIYRRVEVCFPIKDEDIKAQLLHIIQLQLDDNVQAVQLDESLHNTPVSSNNTHPVQSQKAIYDYVKSLSVQ